MLPDTNRLTYIDSIRKQIREANKVTVVNFYVFFQPWKFSFYLQLLMIFLLHNFDFLFE